MKSPRKMIMVLIDRIAAEHGTCRRRVMRKKCRGADYEAKCEVMHTLMKGWGLKSTDIGRVFDVDHSSVLAAVSKHILNADPTDPGARYAARKACRDEATVRQYHEARA